MFAIRERFYAHPVLRTQSPSFNKPTAEDTPHCPATQTFRNSPQIPVASESYYRVLSSSHSFSQFSVSTLMLRFIILPSKISCGNFTRRGRR